MKSFDEWNKVAMDHSLKNYEKVGFAAVHRVETEKNVFPDILHKLSVLREKKKLIMDIGCGCSLPASQLIDHCEKNEHHLILVDCEGMLRNLPDRIFLEKFTHEFPTDQSFLDNYNNKVDVVICYSVIHAIYHFHNIFSFIDKMVRLLRSGGQILIGDIANISKKKRFLSSAHGQEFHKKWSRETRPPHISWNEEYEEIDDSVVIQLLLRYRAMGLETYLLAQPSGLPMNHTREDILICKH